MNSVTVKKALPEDFISVADIGRRTFYETWNFMYSEEDMKIYLAEDFEEQKIKNDLEESGNTFLLAEIGGEIAGYTKLRTDRTYPEFKDNTPIEMERMYVLVEYHDMKIGKALMEESIRLARENKYDWLWLGVQPDNHKAVKFYKGFGFVKFGVKNFKLGNMIDQDDLMKVKL